MSKIDPHEVSGSGYVLASDYGSDLASFGNNLQLNFMRQLYNINSVAGA